MPPVMMTCVTPTAMMPMTDTCRMMIDRRCMFIRKLSPTKIQPRISKTSAMPISTSRMLTSGGSRGALGVRLIVAGLGGYSFAGHGRFLPGACSVA